MLNRVKLLGHCAGWLLLPAIFSLAAAKAQPAGKKVVLISIDGTPDYLLDRFLANGVLPADGAFARMKKMGACAARVLPVNVASTGPSHIAIFTGASPGKTGIVGNSFKKNKAAFASPVLSAFREPIGAETIFQAAMRQGKKVMTLGGPGIDYSAESRMTDYMHMYPVIAGPSLVIDLVTTGSVIDTAGGKRISLLTAGNQSPSKPVFEVAGSFAIPLVLYLQEDAQAGSENGKERPAGIIVDTDSVISNGYAAMVVPGRWTAIAVEKNGRQYNASFSILHVDKKAGNYRLLMTAPAEVYGYPAGFLKKIESSCGLWPGEPENRKQTAGLIPESTWFEQLDRLAAYSKNLLLAGMKEDNWDLLFGYFSTLDDLQHRYTLSNPRQLDYMADNGQRPRRYAGYIEKYFRLIDKYLLEIMNAAPAGTNFVVFSDHGMIPVHTCLLLNNYLQQPGLTVSEQAFACVSSGSAAHVYINREKITGPAYTACLKKLKKHLQDLRDTVTGNRVFEQVADAQQQKKLGLYHPDYSGDLFVSCKPGFSISDRYQPGVNVFVQNSFDPALFEHRGQAERNFLLSGTMNETGRAVHGCLGSTRQGQSIFYSVGPAVPVKNLKKIFSTQIAATVAGLLGIEPPAGAEGKAAF